MTPIRHIRSARSLLAGVAFSGVVAVATLLATGCPGGGRSEQRLPKRERVYFKRSDLRGEERQNIISSVQNHRHEGSGLTTAEWCASTLDELPGEKLFPQWSAVRVAPQKYQVRYTFTHVEKDSAIVRRGYAWRYDALLDLLGDPRELELEEAQRVVSGSGLPGSLPDQPAVNLDLE